MTYNDIHMQKQQNTTHLALSQLTSGVVRVTNLYCTDEFTGDIKGTCLHSIHFYIIVLTELPDSCENHQLGKFLTCLYPENWYWRPVTKWSTFCSVLLPLLWQLITRSSSDGDMGKTLKKMANISSLFQWFVLLITFWRKLLRYNLLLVSCNKSTLRSIMEAGKVNLRYFGKIYIQFSGDDFSPISYQPRSYQPHVKSISAPDYTSPWHIGQMMSAAEGVLKVCVPLCI